MSAIVYLYHSISIDLESSRSCKPTTQQAYSYDPGSHYLLTNQFTISFQEPPGTTFTTLQCPKLLHLPNDQLNQANEPARPTIESTNQIKSSDIEIRFSPRRQLD